MDRGLGEEQFLAIASFWPRDMRSRGANPAAAAANVALYASHFADRENTL
jgi:hypothetical protein